MSTAVTLAMLPAGDAAPGLNCVRVGAGDDVVLIHGLGADLSFWYFGAARLLAARRHVLMYDLRGHGRSPMPRTGYDLRTMADDLRALLDGLGIASADIVGHSFGARVALAFAVQWPERVRNLVVADTQLAALQRPVRLRDWAYWPRWRAELEARGLEDPPGDDAIIDYKLLVRLGRAGQVSVAGMPARRRVALRPPDGGTRGSQRWQQLLQQTTAISDFNDEDPLDRQALGGITAPTLLMFGEFSHCLPTADGLLETMPNARLMVIPGAGHFFPAVKPLYFERGLSSFLDRRGPDEGPLRAARARRLAARRRLRGFAGP